MILNSDLRVVVQGITGKQGQFHTEQMLKYGTKIVAGVTPGKSGEKIFGVPVFDSVTDAVDNTDANCSVIFVPPRFAYSAGIEAIKSQLNPVVVITEGIPVNDTIKMIKFAEYNQTTIIGPNGPGFIIPGITKLGIIPGNYFKKGHTAIISRSGTLTYEIAWNMAMNGLGQSIAIGLGGDPITGINFIDSLKFIENHEPTHSVVILGEIGGEEEEKLSDYIIKTNFSKPVVGFIGGSSAPPEKQMGHAGAIISEGSGTYESKIKALKKAGAKIAIRPIEIPQILNKIV